LQNSITDRTDIKHYLLFGWYQCSGNSPFCQAWEERRWKKTLDKELASAYNAIISNNKEQ
jgi:hypothetical protein